MRRIMAIHTCNDAILKWAMIKFSLVYDNDSPIRSDRGEFTWERKDAKSLPREHLDLTSTVMLTYCKYASTSLHCLESKSNYKVVSCITQNMWE
jgi:hypothetical protein